MTAISKITINILLESIQSKLQSKIAFACLKTSIEDVLDGFDGAAPNRSTIEGLVGLLNDWKYLSQLASAARNETLSKLDIPDALRAKLNVLGNLSVSFVEDC